MATLPLPLLSVSLALASLATPGRGAQDDFAERLARHPLFGHLELETSRASCAPFELWIEVDPDRPQTQRALVEAVHAPWLAALGARLCEGYGVARPTAPLRVVVLASIARYRSAQRYSADPLPVWGRAVALADPGAVVTWLGEHDGQEPPDLLRSDALCAAAEGLLRAAAPAGAEGPARWLVEGLATYHAEHAPGDAPERLSDPPLDSASIEWLGRALREPAWGSWLLPAADLATLQTDDERMALQGARAVAAGVPAPERDQSRMALRCESSLLVTFLVERARAGGRDPLATLRGLVAAGGALDALVPASGASDVLELERDFRAWLAALPAGGAPAAAEQEPPAAARAPQPWPSAGAAHPALLLPVDDPATQLAAALGIAAEGDLDRALAYLDAVGGPDPGAGDERLRAERERLAVLRDAREALLADLVGQSRRLRIVRAGEEIPVPVAARAEGLLVLGRNTEGLERLAVAALTPATLRASFGRRLTDYAPAWIGAYLDLLAGVAGWRAGLDDEPRARALAAAADDLEVAVLDGRALARLAALAAPPLPADAGGLEALLADLGRLAREDGDLALVREAKGGLRDLAAEAWGALLTLRGDETMLAGRTSVLPDGRWKVRYTFEAEGELGDFTRDEEYLRQAREQRFELLPEARAAAFAVADGELSGRGAHCLRHRLAFESPTARYSVAFGESPKSDLFESQILLGICDDRQGSYVGAHNHLDLEVRDAATGHYALASSENRLSVPNASVELRHEGTRVVLLSGGEERQHADPKDRRAGDVFLWIHSNVPLHIGSLEIEGRPTEAGLEALRASWVETRLDELGLGGG